VARKVTKEAVKEVEEQLRQYELVMIFSPELTEEGLAASIEKVSQFITDRQGAIDNVDNWGKKKLAYAIGHFLEGIYVVVRIQMKPAIMKELEASLKISEDIIRFLLTRVDE
jgi:small subunit ribosomal protein S6